jgi:hypothetical protein
MLCEQGGGGRRVDTYFFPFGAGRLEDGIVSTCGHHGNTTFSFNNMIKKTYVVPVSLKL